MTISKSKAAQAVLAAFMTYFAAAGAVAQADELPLVSRRTAIAADVVSRQLARLPSDVLAEASCIAVLSRDVVGWGLAGSELGAGLVSCRLFDRSWSAPSYLTVEGFDLGPNIGFMRQDATFVYMPSVRSRAFRSTFTFDAGVYAVAGPLEAELSVDSTGCITADFRQERHRHCTIAVSDDFGLQAGAYVSAVNVRHMMGFFGGGRVGRNARVYGRNVTIDDILTMPGSLAPDVTAAWVEALTYAAP